MYRIRLVFKDNCFIITITLLLLFSKIQPLLCSNLFPFALSAICMYILDPNTYCCITCSWISWSFFVNSWSCCLHFSCSACNCQDKDFLIYIKTHTLDTANSFTKSYKYFLSYKEVFSSPTKHIHINYISHSF